ncbi:crosslink repair DNA glycosylase YcaQ family protein [Fulvimarina sp. 2208YS6-2-32]|uniref:Crosslink repair DNA glycosylase YcaQ family protein n=2 Tax=Fulvimarina uroteuthidis TaxID=3098149 RepID=A0ABU5I126_9HYPH|nr:crosslink repair DNA glycosylase YcaQ family protein [Fulvimarina sp. 2208YS6-2-32]
MTVPVLCNEAARRVFMARHLLTGSPKGGERPDTLARRVEDLGFVQLDSIRTVERAQHMILRVRHPAYRPAALKTLMERDRAVFEHWTHDASVIPMAFLPYWRFRFARDEARLRATFRRWQGPHFEDKLDETLRHIASEGPVGTRDVGGGEARAGGGWWNWHPSKTALEFLWRTGRLAVTRRDNFNKIYDLSERVYPDGPMAGQAETIDWSCNAALDRLGFATAGELSAFWRIATPQEAGSWAESERAAGRIEHLDVAGHDGRLRRHFARPGLDATIPAMANNPTRVRILSPFDPMLRDRKRAERLFGFSYRIEIFVPEPQRIYGYYVFPVLEGDRIIGRLDARAARSASRLIVRAFWPEAGVRMGRGRIERLTTEIERLARFAQCTLTDYETGWLRTA